MASQQVLTALETLHKELDKLEPAIKHVETAIQVTNTVKGIPGKHLELIEEVKNKDLEHKRELKKLFTQELETISGENNKLLRTTEQILTNTKKEQETLVKLREAVQAFHERVVQINFPDRLDKLDANVAGIVAGIQTLHGRLDNLERNLSDRLKNLEERQKESFSLVKESIHVTSKRQQMFFYITWALIVIAIVVSVAI